MRKAQMTRAQRAIPHIQFFALALWIPGKESWNGYLWIPTIEPFMDKTILRNLGVDYVGPGSNQIGWVDDISGQRTVIARSSEEDWWLGFSDDDTDVEECLAKLYALYEKIQETFPYVYTADRG